jgi:hypothetical protein
MRQTVVHREVMGGCFDCHGDRAHWIGAHAQGVAARHHDATGHTTWTDVVMTVRYGQRAIDGDQMDIETAIAGATA